MKAIVFTKYGSPLALKLKEIARPSPKENEVLVKIHAAAVNDYDWSMVRGKPFIYRLMFGVLTPKKQIPGIELSGIVEACGKNAQAFEVGTEVYGDISEHSFGSFAEYICVNEKALVAKPAKMSFAEAASIPHAAMLAVQGLHDIGNLEHDQKILINGAGGGMGCFALQIARLYNAEITGVDTGGKLAKMSELGFHHVIDYKKEDFTQNGQQYDLILDAKTNRSPLRYLRSLRPSGKYVTVGGQLPRLFQLLVLSPLISFFSKKRMSIVSLKANKDLDYVHELFEKGKIKPVIDGPYALSEVPRLIQYFGEGKHVGKIIITMIEKKK